MSRSSGWPTTTTDSSPAPSATQPDVVVSDIRMPPNFQREGHRRRQGDPQAPPGTGIVILSQFDDPDYAVSLLSEGSAGYAYLLKDRIAEGDQLARAIREVATGGSMLDPVIVSALAEPGAAHGRAERRGRARCSRWSPRARTIKAIAAARGRRRPRWRLASSGCSCSSPKACLPAKTGALDRLRRLHQAIVQREEQGETLCRLLPDRRRRARCSPGARASARRERLEVTVVMSDIRGYTSIAEHADPVMLAGQLNRHRAEMNRAILAAGGTVMQYVGDAVMAVFGAPEPTRRPRRPRARRRRRRCTAPSRPSTRSGRPRGSRPFGLGIGLSTGVVAAALLGSEERVEYTLVGDAVNLCQRLQQFAAPGETVLSEATWHSLSSHPATPRNWNHSSSRVETPRSSLTAHHRAIGEEAASMTVTDAGRHREATSSRPVMRVEVRAAYRTFEQDTAPVRALRGADLAGRPRRVRRRDGAVGLRQVDAAQHHRRARRARRGRGRRRRRVARRHGRERAGDHAPPARRHRVPVLQPARGHDRARERRDAGASSPGASARPPSRGLATCSTCSASATRRSRRPACCRVASASGWRSPGRSPTSRRSCSPTSRPARSTARAARRCSSCSAACTRAARRSCWSPTTSRSPTPRNGSCG